MKRGMTLIELLVTIGIVALMASVGSFAGRRVSSDSRLASSASLIRSAVMRAQSLAKAPPADNNNAQYIMLDITNGADPIIKSGLDTNCANSSNKIIETIELPKDVKPSATKCIAFSVVSPQTAVGFAGTDPFNVIDQKTGRSVTITLYSSGAVDIGVVK